MRKCVSSIRSPFECFWSLCVRCSRQAFLDTKPHYSILTVRTTKKAQEKKTTILGGCCISTTMVAHRVYCSHARSAILQLTISSIQHAFSVFMKHSIRPDVKKIKSHHKITEHSSWTQNSIQPPDRMAHIIHP